MRKLFVTIAIIAVAVALSASQYPDSVQQASKAEPNIAYGWNFEFAGGLGVGSYTYQQIGQSFTNTDRHVSNKVHFPSWNAAFGLSYYFVPWMGLGTGVQFSDYTNKAAVTEPWKTPSEPMLKDPFGDEYQLTTTPDNVYENQHLYMIEVPIALKFRARPGVVGFTATAGMKLGFPVANSYRLSGKGEMQNSVYYPFYDLTIQDVPTVVENIPITGASGSYESYRWKKLNYAAYAEIGMLVRVHQRVELAITAFANYYINDVMDVHNTNPLAFANYGTSVGEYKVPYTAAYNGVLRTNEAESVHPWNVGLKIGVQINANRTKAQRDYDREQRKKRQEQLAEQTQEEEPVETLLPVIDTLAEVVDTIPELAEDTLPDLILPDPREEAIRRILEIAEANDINICTTFCQIHDTVYREIHDTINLYRDPEPTPVIKEDTVAKQLDDMLSEAVIFFDLDKAVPILEPADILVRIAEVLKRHPNQKIHVNGHACKLGKPDYNQRLAMRRAKAVVEQLKALGVREDQLMTASLGADMPYRYNGHHQLSKDRRVEIVPTYQTTEIVVSGTRLAQIARRHYGNPDFWVFIYEANKEDIPNPSELEPGMVLEIPNLSERLKGMNESQIMDEVKRLKETIIKK